MSELTRRVTNLEDAQIETNRHLTGLEGGMGKALHGITEIKNLLTRPDDPTAGYGLNGSSPSEG